MCCAVVIWLHLWFELCRFLPLLRVIQLPFECKSDRKFSLVRSFVFVVVFFFVLSEDSSSEGEGGVKIERTIMTTRSRVTKLFPAEYSCALRIYETNSQWNRQKCEKIKCQRTPKIHLYYSLNDEGKGGQFVYSFETLHFANSLPVRVFKS